MKRADYVRLTLLEIFIGYPLLILSEFPPFKRFLDRNGKSILKYLRRYE